MGSMDWFCERSGTFSPLVASISKPGTEPLDRDYMNCLWNIGAGNLWQYQASVLYATTIRHVNHSAPGINLIAKPWVVYLCKSFATLEIAALAAQRFLCHTMLTAATARAGATE